MVPADVQSITDPVERTRAYMDAVDIRWQALRAMNPPATESQFWLDFAAWEAYYQLRRGGMFGITAADYQGAWDDTSVFDSKLEKYELDFLTLGPGGGGVPSGPLPPKPGLPQPQPQGPSQAEQAAKKFPWLEVGAVALVAVVAGALVYSEI